MNKRIKNVIFFSISFILVVCAMVAGYYEANAIAEGITQEADERIKQSAQAEQTGLTEGASAEAVTADGGESDENGKITVAPKFTELICSLDEASGEIDDIVIHITDCIGMQTIFIYLEPECGYTMSSGLYRDLASGNVILPQTVRLSKLPEYYGENSREKAMGALKRIVSELLGYEVDYYTVLAEPEFYSLFLVKKGNVQDKLALNCSKKQVNGKSPGQDTCRDFVEAMFSASLSDFEMEKRMVYVNAWDEIDSGSVIYGIVKVKEKNEGISAEIDSGLQMLLEQGQ